MSRVSKDLSLDFLIQECPRLETLIYGSQSESVMKILWGLAKKLDDLESYKFCALLI